MPRSHLFPRDLLPDQSPDLFRKWIFRFLYDIIATSTKSVCILSPPVLLLTLFLFRYPLVSGVYRFGTFVMNICLKLDYFKVMRTIEANSSVLLRTFNSRNTR